MTAKELEIIEKEYLNELQRIKDTIRQNQNKAIVVVNSAMIMTYYEIGTIINERKVWGNKYIERLSNDLKEYGSGYSKSNLKYMSQFASAFSYGEISQRGVGQISWRTTITIMSKCKTHEEMMFYVELARKNSWGKDMICNQIAMKAYERSLIEPTTTAVVYASNDELVNELFKDTYVFDFLDREKIKNDKDLKKQMIDNIIKEIDKKRTVYDYNLLGALGIPDVGSKIFKKFLNIYYIDDLMNIALKSRISELTKVPGIKEKTANKVIIGLITNAKLIEFLKNELLIKHDKKKYVMKVIFSKIRDKKFEDYLEDKDVEVCDGYNKKIDIVICEDPNSSSTKIEKAKSDGKKVMSLKEAYKYFKYK